MRRGWSWWTISSVLLLANLAQAESDGSTARITDFGNGVGMISEPHDTHNTQPSRFDRNTQSHQDPGAVTMFGSPAPPNHLTPAPVLPFNPNRSVAPAMSSPPSNTGSSTGRFGR